MSGLPPVFLGQLRNIQETYNDALRNENKDVPEHVELLSKSSTVAALLGAPHSDEDYNELHAVLFNVLTSFVVGHEWTHHVHGHVDLPDTEAMFPNEIPDVGENGQRTCSCAQHQT